MDEDYEEDDVSPSGPLLALLGDHRASRTIPTIELMKERYENAKGAKVKAECVCPSCGTKYIKKSYQQAFCSNKGTKNCKDQYWNRMIPGRIYR